MAALSTANPTLLDVAKRLDPNGNIDKIVELLNQTNEVLDDAVWVESNLPTGHRSTIRSGIPAPTWRKLYGFVQPSHSRTVQVTDNIGMLEAYAEVDKALADLNGNTAEFRMSEDVAFIEGMNREFVQTLFYGNEGVEPAEFTGLTPRYNSLSAENALNVINAGGAGTDNTSIWLVVWSPRTIHCIYPKGSTAGLQMKDKGQVTVQDANNGRMEAYRTHYRWDCGLVVRDWRYAVRIANIDVSDMANPTNAKNLVTYMIQAIERIPSLNAGKAAFYATRRMREALRLGVLEKISSQLTWDTVAGKSVLLFDGIPVRRVDQLLETESVVS